MSLRLISPPESIFEKVKAQAPLFAGLKMIASAEIGGGFRYE
ncbi:MAG: hypothetical protein QGI08_08280 [Paracoccaceae bacterium]|jgi:hypothetical protein|nr:hypothetical protein [Paracoccaceae bacterium]